MGKEQTIGEYRVGVNFNQSKESIVDEIKVASAALIDLIYYADVGANTSVNEYEVTEAFELQELAVRRIEEGAMWAVKAVTKN